MSARKETERQLPTLREDLSSEARPRAHAVVYVADRSLFVDLEEGRTVVLGRTEEADVEVPTPTVSRRHLALRWAGGQLTVRDCGSTNGTLVDGQPLTGEAVLEGGEQIAIGEALVVVGKTTPLPAARRVLSAAALDDQLGLEIVRAARLGRSLALLRIRMRGVDDAVAASAFEDLLRALPETATATAFDDGDCRVVVPDADVDPLVASCRAVLAARGLARAEAGVGGATFPRDGGDRRSLEEAASRSLDARGEPGPRGVAPADAPVAVDPVTVRLFALVDRVARHEGTVLLVGETGAGKDVVAREVHRRSPRASGPFVHVNCGAIPSTLFEREMFGHERGAFTGAKERRIGLFEAASGGTLFLDEIGEIPLADQVRLLRAIETRAVCRVGGSEEIPVDIRIVAATNRDLEDLVGRGLFREDLFYRLTVLNVLVPALRDRKGDVAPLAARFFAELSQAAGRPDLRLAPDATPVLERYGWPGNVRELRNVVERAVLLASGPEVTGADLLGVLYGEPVERADLCRDVTLKTVVEEVERLAILRALEACGQNQSLAADRLGVSRRTLIYKMRRYEISGRGRGVH